MRLVLLLGLLAAAGCASKGRSEAAQADALALRGDWFGIDDAGALWWRLELDEGRRGLGGFESDGAVARYRVTDWTSEAEGAVVVEMVRAEEVSALDRAPRTIRLAGRSDGVRLRLHWGKSEIVLLREDELIPARNRLKARMEAE